MGRVYRSIACVCCGKTGASQARGLIMACYSRHARAGTLARFPSTRRPPAPWQPIRPGTRQAVEQYAELAELTPPLSKRRIAWELGVSERTVERYAAAHSEREER